MSVNKTKLSFCEWFSDQLEKAHKTQQQVANECGLSRSYIAMVKSGEARPSAGSLFLLATSLDANLDDAFEAAGIEMPVNLRKTSNIQERQILDKLKLQAEQSKSELFSTSVA